MRHLCPSIQPFSTHDLVNQKLDGGFFLLDNAARAEWIQTMSYEALTPAMMFSHYLVSAFSASITVQFTRFIHDAKARPVHLLGVFILRILLGKYHIMVSFIVTKHLAASMIVGTEFLNRHIRAIRCVEVIVE